MKSFDFKFSNVVKTINYCKTNNIPVICVQYFIFEKLVDRKKNTIRNNRSSIQLALSFKSA
jgi:hypothetical protein